MLDLSNYNFTDSIIPRAIAERISLLTNKAGRLTNVCKTDPLLIQFCNENQTTLQELTYMLKHNILSFRYCKVCGKKLINPKSVYCCCSCRNKDSDWQQKFSQRSIERYGTLWPSSSQTIKDKVKATDNTVVLDGKTRKQIRLKKLKQTCLEKYGVDNIFKTEQFKQYLKQYNLEHYGVEYTTQANEVKAKKVQAFREKYRVDVPAKNKQIRQKMKDTYIDRYGEQAYYNHLKHAVKNKYGVDNISQTSQWKQKFIATSLEKYGTEHPNQNAEQISQIVYSNHPQLYDEFIKGIAEKGYCCLTSYDDFWDFSKSIELRHVCGRSIQVITRSWYHVPACECQIHSSIGEKQLLTYIRDLLPNVDINTNDKTILGDRSELDIYIPSLKIAFEYNGNYWHSTNFRDKYYHTNKTLKALQKGIRVIHVYEFWWENRQQIIKSIIKDVLNLCDQTINLKDCIKQNITTEQYNKFIIDNGLYCTSPIHPIGWFKNNELVFVANINCDVCIDHCGKLDIHFDNFDQVIKTDYVVNGSYEKINLNKPLLEPSMVGIKNALVTMNGVDDLDNCWLREYLCSNQLIRLGETETVEL